MSRSALRISAAMALAIMVTAPAMAAKLRLPPPRAPEQKIFAPVAIAADLQKRGYRIESMKRQGTAYSIRAIGPHKNKVQLMVDGRSGEIVGLAVIDPVADFVSLIAKAMTSGKNARYIDDRYPFGIVVPEVYQTNWVVIPTWTAVGAAPRYIDAKASARGYRYAVPYKTIRPGRGGKSRSTVAPARMQKPVYDVYESNGAQLETASYSEDTAILTEVTTEETTYSEEYSVMEESYLGGEITEETSVEISDFDAEDGDMSFADDAGDSYAAAVDETETDAVSDEAEDAGDLSDDDGEVGEDSVDEVEDSRDEAEDSSEEESDDAAEEVDDAEESDDAAEDYDDSADEAEDPDDGGDDGDYDDGGDEEDYDDGGDDDGGDYDDGGDDPEAARR